MIFFILDYWHLHPRPSVLYLTLRTQVFSSVHGDYFRELAGAKSISKQIEFMKEFGTAAAAAPTSFDLKSKASVPVLSRVVSDTEVEVTIDTSPLSYQDAATVTLTSLPSSLVPVIAPTSAVLLQDPTVSGGGDIRQVQDL